MRRKRGAGAASLLALLALGYAALEWKMAATIGPHTVFARDRAAERAEFVSYTLALDQAIVRECAGGRTKWIVLNDADIALPWLSGSTRQGGGCRILRPTLVSPLAALPEPASEPGACSAVMVEEWSDYKVRASTVPGQAEPWVGGQGLGQALLERADWQRAQAWNSADGTYHFAFYRQSGCPA